MAKPKLFIFAISHYCEKSRWALDYLGVDYDLVPIAPGVHIKLSQKLGLSKSSVPILVDGDTVIQGSADIITWGENKSGNSLTPINDVTECAAIENRLDEIAGVHVRRCYYSEAMIDYSDTVRPLFLKGIPFLHKLVVRWKWSFIRKIMIKKMDLGPSQHVESRNIIDAELKWLDDILAEGKPYLLGDTFSRADIAMASLFAPLVLPKEHPTYANLELPPLMKEIAVKWHDRASLKHALAVYRQFR
jgi:glutathione S-transferase